MDPRVSIERFTQKTHKKRNIILSDLIQKKKRKKTKKNNLQ